MRSLVIGAFFAKDREQFDAYVKISTCLTHSDPKALTGARAVAGLCSWVVSENLNQRPSEEVFIQRLLESGNDELWRERVRAMEEALRENLTVVDFAYSIGQNNGISGYIYNTVPVVAYAWFRHFGNFEDTVSSVLGCGGDTDTTGAIAGALAGAVCGEQGIPQDWVEGLWEWPRSLRVMRTIAERLAEAKRSRENPGPVSYFLPGVLVRNLFFLTIVLAWGFRRLLPPY
jgi:ADP-ribosylglycohydrolase